MRRFPLLLLLPLALLAASCGGGGGDSGGSISEQDAAVVNGTHITRSELDRLVRQYKCSYDLQKRAFPKPGSASYQAVQSQALQALVERTELAQQAPDLDASVSQKQVDERLEQLKKRYFGGSEKRYRTALRRQCITDSEVRTQVRAELLSAAIYKKVTGKATVSAGDVEAYYNSHKGTYTQQPSRVVRHILVKDKALADKLYRQLAGGAAFAALAKKYSLDPASKTQGGQLTATKGHTVPEFDKVAFALKTGATSKPVHTQYGWHIVQALKPATPRKTTPLSQVKESIRQQLLQQKRTNAIRAWLDGVKKEYASKVTYATGLAPATTSTPTTTTTG